MKEVERQYTNWVYPTPIEDMRIAIADGSYWEIGDPILYHQLFWPHMRGREKLDILVAGCGSVQAAYYACRNPNWNVIGVDLSDSSLAHQQKLKDRHSLTNLLLQKMDLTKVHLLGETFDFIVSTGVLHHLPNPEDGLAALRDVLRVDGVINLMVYGKSLRLGVYMMQEVFRLLQFKQTQDDVEIVKATIRDLAPDHVLQRYLYNTNDLHYDAAYVDTFLHPLDKAYSAGEIFEFTRKSGLEFLTWCDPVDYCLEAIVPKGHALWSKLRNLTPEVEAHICDLLTQLRGTHRWAAAHNQYVQRVRVPSDNSLFFQCVVAPHRNAHFTNQTSLEGGQKYCCMRAGYTFEIHPVVFDIMTKADGMKSMQYLAESHDIFNEKNNDLLSIVKSQIMSLSKQGHVHILLPREI